MAGNTVNLVFAGDARGAQNASEQTANGLNTVGTAATSASSDMQEAGQASSAYVDRVGKLGAAVEGAATAFDSIGQATTALVDIQNAARERAMRLARAQADVEQALIDQQQAAVDAEQATLDLAQAQTDGRQAGLDAEQAALDVKQAYIDMSTATDEYNAAVKEHGKNSAEAQQAQQDLLQAQQDLKQANLDSEQAQRDATQAQIDAKQAVVDGTQAVRDGKDAQLDLNDAMHAANPSGLQKFAENINLITPLLSAIVGVIGLVTAAQWAWNIAMTANPIGLIVAGVTVLIGVIVLIATKTDWFQRLWKWAWGGIKDAASAVGRWFTQTVPNWFSNAWNRIKDKAESVGNWLRAMPGRLRSAFANLGSWLFAPFRTAFNRVASAWNSTIGRLSWTIPGWVPGVGGNSISAPRLPHFHQGGTVPGAPGTEVVAVLQAGEKISSRASTVASGGPTYVVVEIDGREIVRATAKTVQDMGGSARYLGIKAA